MIDSQQAIADPIVKVTLAGQWLMFADNNSMRFWNARSWRVEEE